MGRSCWTVAGLSVVTCGALVTENEPLAAVALVLAAVVAVWDRARPRHRQNHHLHYHTDHPNQHHDPTGHAAHLEGHYTACPARRPTLPPRVPQARRKFLPALARAPRNARSRHTVEVRAGPGGWVGDAAGLLLADDAATPELAVPQDGRWDYTVPSVADGVATEQAGGGADTFDFGIFSSIKDTITNLTTFNPNSSPGAPFDVFGWSNSVLGIGQPAAPAEDNPLNDGLGALAAPFAAFCKSWVLLIIPIAGALVLVVGGILLVSKLFLTPVSEMDGYEGPDESLMMTSLDVIEDNKFNFNPIAAVSDMLADKPQEADPDGQYEDTGIPWPQFVPPFVRSLVGGPLVTVGDATRMDYYDPSRD